MDLLENILAELVEPSGQELRECYISCNVHPSALTSWEGGKTTEKWKLVWLDGAIVGVVRNGLVYLPHKSRERATFFRTLEKEGFQERIEFRGARLESLMGDIRQNVHAWWFDDWTLQAFFKVE
jgi:hypothetical protein